MTMHQPIAGVICFESNDDEAVLGQKNHVAPGGVDQVGDKCLLRVVRVFDLPEYRKVMAV